MVGQDFLLPAWWWVSGSRFSSPRRPLTSKFCCWTMLTTCFLVFEKIFGHLLRLRDNFRGFFELRDTAGTYGNRASKIFRSSFGWMKVAGGPDSSLNRQLLVLWTTRFFRNCSEFRCLNIQILYTIANYVKVLFTPCDCSHYIL